MKIVRLTRHEAGPEQISELCRIFGQEAEIAMVSETLPSDGKQAVARFDQLSEGADVVEAVLPINLLEAVLKFSAFSKKGGVVIRAITERKLDEAGQATFAFDHYEKIVKVEVITERL